MKKTSPNTFKVSEESRKTEITEEMPHSETPVEKALFVRYLYRETLEKQAAIPENDRTKEVSPGKSTEKADGKSAEKADGKSTEKADEKTSGAAAENPREGFSGESLETNAANTTEKRKINPEENQKKEPVRDPANGGEWHVDLQCYRKALNELKKDLSSTSSVFSQDSDEFTQIIDIMKKIADSEDPDQQMMTDGIDALADGIEKYKNHPTEQFITDDRREKRIAVIEKTEELTVKFKKGVKDPKSEDCDLATARILSVAGKCVKGMKKDAMESILRKSPSYNQFVNVTSMYGLSRVAKEQKLAAEMLRKIVERDRILAAGEIGNPAGTSYGAISGYSAQDA